MTTQNPQDNARLVAARFLARWLREGDFPDRMIEASDLADRAFVMEVVYGVVRWQRRLDWVADQVADRPPDRRVYPFLLVGLYQVLMLDDVAEYAAVHETVSAAKAGGAERAAGFLNALLRRVLREKETLRAAIDHLPLAVRESHPDVLVARWSARYGEDRTAALCAWNNTRPRVILHPNRLRITMDDYRALLRDAGIEARPHPFAPEQFLALTRGTAVRKLPGYGEGLFSVRDPSTEAALELLDPRPGETVLDACAAPGGKVCGIAERMEDRGAITAMDLHEDRLSILRANLERLGVTCARVVRGDAAAAGGWTERFDRILLDVPCTNTGVLRRRPDARWRISERKINTLARTQRGMLDAVGALVKPGGTLVYSTCSLEPEEGEALVRGWAASHPAYQLSGEVALFPPETETDGIYAARLVKAAGPDSRQ